jgi:hypothetical protein
MRIAPLIARFIASLAAAGALALATPMSAKSSDAQKSEDKPTSSSCSAYQQAPDGAWVRLPCKEEGARGQAQTQHRPTPHGADHDTR